MVRATSEFTHRRKDLAVPPKSVRGALLVEHRLVNDGLRLTAAYLRDAYTLTLPGLSTHRFR